jgi:hypothetical protein
MSNPLGTVGSQEPSVQIPLKGSSSRAPGARRRIWSRWLLLVLVLVLGYLAQVAFRLWLSRHSVVPLANPDESAYLIEARVLAHVGVPADFSDGTLYQSGYSLLLVPIYWFTSNSVTVYHAAMVVNAIVNALLMPLGYLAMRRLSAPRWLACLGGAVAALVPEGVFYTQYALSDAIFPVVVLGWLLAVHSWLTAKSRRASAGWSALSALLAGYSYTVHPRGLVLIVALVMVAIYAAIRRMVPISSLVPAAVVSAAMLAFTRALQHKIVTLLYPEGPFSLRGSALGHLAKPSEQVKILDMVGGQLWRVFTDTWGIAALGILAAVVVVFRRGGREDLRVMAALSLIVLGATVYIAPAALPDAQGMDWTSGRYSDAMEVIFFLVGLIVLMRARGRWLIGYAAVGAVLGGVLALDVSHYAGTYQHIQGFGAFRWAEPVVLTHASGTMSVHRATEVAIGLLALWTALALLVRWYCGRSRHRDLGNRGRPARWPLGRWRAVVLLPILAMNVYALVEMTSRISQEGTQYQEPNSLGLVTGAGLKPGDKMALDYDMQAQWGSWLPQSFEVWWTTMPRVDGAKGVLPAGTTVFEVAWPSGDTPEQTWPQHLPGWHVAVSNSQYHWVAWRGPAAVGH